jgi:hypothetical protein
MIVLKTTTEPQTIKITPREYILEGKVILIRKNERDATIYPAEFNRVGNYMEVLCSYDLIQDNRYSLIIVSASFSFFNRVSEDSGILEATYCTEQELSESLDTEDILYRDMVLCTDQDEYDTYDIQKNEYVQPKNSDNRFIVRD